MIPTYGGFPIFGLAPEIIHLPNPNAQQIASFFGVLGVQSLFGGSRGRAFEIEGILTGLSPAGCVASEGLMLSYADGNARVLTDTTGTGWPNVIFKGAYMRQKVGDVQFFYISQFFVWGMKYKAVFDGLT